MAGKKGVTIFIFKALISILMEHGRYVAIKNPIHEALFNSVLISIIAVFMDQNLGQTRECYLICRSTQTIYPFCANSSNDPSKPPGSISTRSPRCP